MDGKKTYAHHRSLWFVAAGCASLLMFTSMTTAQTPDLSDGLVAYWTMDEESGTREDAYGSADFVEIGATVSSTIGVLGNAADFVAVGHLASSATVISPTSFTVNLWMSPTVDTQSLLVAQDDGTLDGIVLFAAYPDVTLCILAYPSMTPCLTTTLQLTISMITASYDGEDMRICANTACNESAESVSPTISIDAGPVVGSGLVGWIDEIGIWDRALTDEELVELYNGGAGLSYDDFEEPTPTPTPLATPLPEATPTRTPTERESYIPPNEGIHINSPEVVMSARLPMALPDLPGLVELQTVGLPYINYSAWPSIADEREQMINTANDRLDSIRAMFTASYNSVDAVFETVDNSLVDMRTFIGDPLATTAGSGSGSVTVVGMAQQMAQGTSVALGYLRSVARMGPVGVDLVFVFVGLGWMMFLTFGEWLLIIIASILKLLVGIVRWIVDHIIAFVKWVVDIFIPF